MERNSKLKKLNIYCGLKESNKKKYLFEALQLLSFFVLI